MNSMIEAAGQAIQAAWNDGSEAAETLPPIEFTPDEEQHLARAVIQAMIDHGPTEEMIEAGCQASHEMREKMWEREQSDNPEELPDYDEGDLCETIFTAMLRKILEE